MDYKEDELRIIYNNAINKKNTLNELNDIYKELVLICPIMEYDEFVLQDLIDTLYYFKNVNMLDKINIDTINLLRQIINGNKQDIINIDNNEYITIFLKNLLLPFNINKCDKDYNIKKYLSDFDILINLIRDNCNIEDYKILYAYNKDLHEISSRFYEIMDNLENTNVFIYGGLKEKILLNGIISHLATMLYLSLDKFEYQYDLLNETYEEILNNIFNFLIVCDDIKIFQDIVPRDKLEILREYKYALELLEKQDTKRKKRSLL